MSYQLVSARVRVWIQALRRGWTVGDSASEVEVRGFVGRRVWERRGEGRVSVAGRDFVA